MASKSLVLDIEGVVLRDKDLLTHVQHNCIRYIQKKLPSCKDPARLNRIFLKSNVRTDRGLKNCFKIDVSDFNNEVYDVPLRSHLWEVLSSTDFQREATDIHNMITKGWSVTLLSDSPFAWAGQVAHAISDQVRVSDGKYGDFAKHHLHIYVDDSVDNVKTASQVPNWHPILFGDTDPRWPGPTIGSIWELGLFLGTVDYFVD